MQKVLFAHMYLTCRIPMPLSIELMSSMTSVLIRHRPYIVRKNRYIGYGNVITSDRIHDRGIKKHFNIFWKIYFRIMFYIIMLRGFSWHYFRCEPSSIYACMLQTKKSCVGKEYFLTLKRHCGEGLASILIRWVLCWDSASDFTEHWMLIQHLNQLNGNKVVTGGNKNWCVASIKASWLAHIDKHCNRRRIHISSGQII